MELLKIAQDIELEGFHFYTDLADQATTKEIRGIFSFLANEEMNHYDLFDSWDNDNNSNLMDDETTLDDLNITCDNFFQFVKKNNIAFTDQGAAYERAIAIEQKSIDFYTGELKKTTNNKLKELLNRIIKEEEIHHALIKSIINFNNHTGEWLEDFEWHHSLETFEP